SSLFNCLLFHIYPTFLSSSLRCPQPPEIYTFPYTTLFRSGLPAPHGSRCRISFSRSALTWASGSSRSTRWLGARSSGEADSAPRSEEHTSELQSRVDLVCRLLLEKKKYQSAVVKQIRQYKK